MVSKTLSRKKSEAFLLAKNSKRRSNNEKQKRLFFNQVRQRGKTGEKYCSVIHNDLKKIFIIKKWATTQRICLLRLGSGVNREAGMPLWKV